MFKGLDAFYCCRAAVVYGSGGVFACLLVLPLLSLPRPFRPAVKALKSPLKKEKHSLSDEQHLLDFFVLFAWYLLPYTYLHSVLSLFTLNCFFMGFFFHSIS